MDALLKISHNALPLGAVGIKPSKLITTKTIIMTQNKTINGSGSTTKIIDGLGQQSIVVFYPFNYQFKTAGEHTITFTSGGVSAEVKVSVEASEN